MKNILKIVSVTLMLLFLFACESDSDGIDYEGYFDLPESFTFHPEEILLIDFEDYTNFTNIDDLLLTVIGNENVITEINDLMVAFSAYDVWTGTEVLTFTISDDFVRTTLMDTVTVTVEPNDHKRYFDLPESFTFHPEEILLIDFADYTNFTNIDNPLITVAGNENVVTEINDLMVAFSAYNIWTGTEALTFTITDDFVRTTLMDTVTVIVEPNDHADILIFNLSDNPANVFIHHSSSSFSIQLFVPANSSNIVSIEDGNAGLNIYGGQAVIDFRHVINNEEVDQMSSTSAVLSPHITSNVQIDNPYGCLDIESFSQTSDMWVTIDNGSSEIIPALGDLTKFYDPTGISIDKSINYNGYTVFAGQTAITVIEDNYTRLDIYPDAGCIRINNTSASFYITEVYISPSSEPTWGANDLMNAIEPGYFFAWTVSPDTSWDVKVVDNYDDVFTIMGNYIEVDDVIIYDYDGFRELRTTTADQDKIISAQNAETTITNPRCEANNF